MIGFVGVMVGGREGFKPLTFPMYGINGGR